MPEFAGINHVALTVTDLDVSERFYTRGLGFLTLMDVGYGRICLHKGTGFTLALLRLDEASGGRFTERTTGLDHLGLAARDRAELVEWEERLRAVGAEVSPIRDMPLGHHLNFRDPDGIALELQAPTPEYAAALAMVRTRGLSDGDVLAMVEAQMGPDVLPKPLS